MLRPALEAAGIKADIQGRPKHLTSIWKKMERKGAEFDEIYDVYAIRCLVDEVKRLLRGPGHRPLAVAADPRPVRRLHRDAQEQPLPEPPYRGHRDGWQAPRDPDPDPSDAPGVRGRHRRPLALQGRLEGRSRVRRQAGLAAPAHGLAARRGRRDRVRRGHQARHLPGSGLRVHAQGRRQGPAGWLDADRLRLSDPHRRRPSLHRRQGQQPAGPPGLPPAQRRHRRDRHDQGRPRALARLAECRPDEPRPGEDPGLVQAPGAGREHRPRPGVARARAAPLGPDLDPGNRPDADHRGRPVVQPRQPRRLLCGHRLRRGGRPAGRHAPGRGRRRGAGPAHGRARASRSGPAASGSRAWATC